VNFLSPFSILSAFLGELGASRRLVCSKSHQLVLLHLVVFARRRAQRGVMRTRRLAHDRSRLDLQRSPPSVVQASLVFLHPNSRLSHRENLFPYARICKAGMLA
jgi:hypothetical protein